MSRITKEIAENVATKLVQSKKQVIDCLRKKLENEVKEHVIKEVPLEVMLVFNKNPNFIRVERRVEISGNGWNFQSVYLDKAIPCNNNYKINFIPEAKIANELLLIFNEISDKEKEIKLLKNDLINTIYNLRTYKSVELNFTEAFELLPKIINNSVQLNLSEIRNRLKN